MGGTGWTTQGETYVQLNTPFKSQVITAAGITIEDCMLVIHIERQRQWLQSLKRFQMSLGPSKESAGVAAFCLLSDKDLL